MKDWAALPLRLGLGVIFLGHGLQKAFALFGGSGVEGFSKMLSGLGFYQPVLLAYFVAYVELIGGALLILGLLTRVASMFIFLVIAVAAYSVHLPRGFFLLKGGVEYNLLILCACISLMMLGPGKLSISKRF